MAASEQIVFVLHARQPLTTDPGSALPGPDAELVVLSTPQAGSVMREDVAADPPVIRAPREQWAAQIRALSGGRPIGIATNDEYCLTDCRDLRADFGLAPVHPDDLSGYLDKVRMKERLNAGAVATARYTDLGEVRPDPGLARRLAADLGLPVVAKPRQEANSRGVEVLGTVDELSAWLERRAGATGWHIEEFLAGTQYHANAIVRDGVVTPVMAGRYCGPLIGFGRGRRIGSVTLPPDGAEAAAAHALNASVVAALGGAGAFVVHTEYMVRPDGSAAVLEVAARAPGALVSAAAKLHAGVDLEYANLALQTGAPIPQPAQTGVGAGWVWVPVLPGERFGSGPEFAGHSLVHTYRAAREGHTGASGALGASALLWSEDADLLAVDLDTALTWDWTA